MTDPLAPDRLTPPTPGQLRRLLAAEKLQPRRSLSQNFLTDGATLDAIVDAAELAAGDRVVEVGPGLGVLTRRLLKAGAAVVAVELDPRLAEWLRRELGAVDGFSLVEADALTFDAASAFPGEPFKVVANIPYHITSPLLHGFLEGERPPELVVLLVQAEVAERIAAPPGQMSYLSVFAQNVAEVEIVTRVPAAAFEPAPTVDSAVLRLRRRSAPVVPPGGRREPFYRLVQAGFRQRRKQLHNALSRELGADRQVLADGLCGLRGRAGAAGADPHRGAMGLPPRRAGAGAGGRGVTPLRLEAPAKLNLSLAVTGRRADGFHELDSELVLLELADRLLLLPGCSGLRLEGEGSETLPLGTENLAWRGLLAGIGARARPRVPHPGEADPGRRRAGRRLVRCSRGLAPGPPLRASVRHPGCRDAGPAVVDRGGRAVLCRPGRGRTRDRHRGACQPSARGDGGGPGRAGTPARSPSARPPSSPSCSRRSGVASPSGDGTTCWRRRSACNPPSRTCMRLMVAAGGAPQLTGSGPTVFAITDDPERAAAITARLQRGGLRATHTRLRAEPASIEAIEEPEE